MRLAIFRAMLLGLLRDPAALVMSFVLPPLVFLIFATIFASASSGDLTIKLAVADEGKEPAALAVVARLLEDKRFQKVAGPALDGARARELVRAGDADAALIFPANARSILDMRGAGAAPLLVIAHPTKDIAAAMLSGALQRAYYAAVPDATVRAVANLIEERFVPFSPQQRAGIDQGLIAMGESARGKGDGAGNAAGAGTASLDNTSGSDSLGVDRLITRESAITTTGTVTAVTYYAGAVAIMFLLFSALTGAGTYLEERESGLLDRLAMSPGGVGVLVDGKFLFLVVQGLIQAALIYAAAALVFGLDVIGAALPWLALTTAAAIGAAGLALLFVCLCASKRQAEVLGQMAVLIASAIGGSMVPRYLMPEWAQTIGWATPNTWVVEGYSAIFLRGADVAAIWQPIAVVGLIGIMAVIAARIIAIRSV